MSRQPVIDLTCMLCGRHAGQIVAGRFRPHALLAAPVSVGGSLRCATCGGAIYRDEDPVTTTREPMPIA
jgi:hypothetical protein